MVVTGTLHAYDATDLSRELWNCDTLGRYAKCVAPTVVNGGVCVPTFSGLLAIYGLLSSAGQTNSDVKISAIANSASLMGNSVAPSKVVAIFGTNLGPPGIVQMEIGASGHVPNVLAGTQVLFNGVPAPVLYTSIGEVGAVVPSGINADNRPQRCQCPLFRRIRRFMHKTEQAVFLDRYSMRTAP